MSRQARIRTIHVRDLKGKFLVAALGGSYESQIIIHLNAGQVIGHCVCRRPGLPTESDSRAPENL